MPWQPLRIKTLQLPDPYYDLGQILHQFSISITYYLQVGDQKYGIYFHAGRHYWLRFEGKEEFLVLITQSSEELEQLSMTCYIVNGSFEANIMNITEFTDGKCVAIHPFEVKIAVWVPPQSCPIISLVQDLPYSGRTDIPQTELKIFL